MIFYFNFIFVGLLASFQHRLYLAHENNKVVQTIQILNLECWVIIRNQFILNLTKSKSKSKLYKVDNCIQMSKDKKLRKIVIEKLFHKNENLMKQSTRSNAPTESTPNEPKVFSKAIQNFFQNFQAQCAIIYEPIKIKNHRPLKRSLEQQLYSLYHDDRKINFKTQQSHTLKTSRISKNPSSIAWSGSQRDKNSRMHTQNSNFEANQRQNKKTYTNAEKQSISKFKQTIFNRISISKSQILFKPRVIQSQSRFQRQSSQSIIKRQKNKQIYQKLPPNFDFQDNKYVTNSKYLASKYGVKNAPVKQQQKAPKVDRIKRIQSLKNLNQNGIRKYSYKRQL